MLPEVAGKPVGTERFKTRSQCFITQYGSFLLPEAGSKPVGTERFQTRPKCFIDQYGNILLPEAGGKLGRYRRVSDKIEMFH